MREQTIYFGCDRCNMTLNLPTAFTELTKANMRKIFFMIFQEPGRNAEAIRIIDEVLPEISEELKGKWETASKKFYDEYKDPSYEYYTEDGISKKYTKKQLISIRAKNKRMMQAVKSAKRNYEMFLPRIELWEEIKQQKL